MSSDYRFINCFNKDFIDWICNSDQNFYDSSIKKEQIFENQQIWNTLIDGINSAYDFYCVDDLSYLMGVYTRNEQIIRHVDYMLQVNYPTVDCLTNYLLSNNEMINKPGLYVREDILIRFLLENAPVCTLNTLSLSSNIRDFISVYGVEYLMALTRIYENSSWHAEMNKLYSTLSMSDFEVRNIKLITLSKQHIVHSYNEMRKRPVWEDKIGGSIFMFDCNVEHPLRLIVRLYHYIKEMEIHSTIMFRYSNSGCFQDLFHRYFLQLKPDPLLFLEPHCILEAICWVYTLDSIKKDFSLLCDSIKALQSHIVYIDLSRHIIISSDFIDCISNDYKGRAFPGKHRMLSMAVKLEILKSLTNGNYEQLAIEFASESSVFPKVRDYNRKPSKQ